MKDFKKFDLNEKTETTASDSSVTHSSKLLHLAIKIVEDINHTFYQNDYTNYVTLTTDGNCYEVEYMGVRIFQSEEDMRDDDETLYDHLWSKINDVNNETKECPTNKEI